MTDVVQEHFDKIAKKYDFYKEKNKYYYSHLQNLLCKLIPPSKKILEVGCGTGTLLASIFPEKGWGIDISLEMIKIAKKRYQGAENLKFSTSEISNFSNKSLDFIFMCDVIEHLEYPEKIFFQIRKIMHKDTVFICTMANPRWEWILNLAEKLKLKMPEGKHYRWSYKQINSFLKKAGLEVEKHGYSLLMPINIPFLSDLLNRHLERPLAKYAFIEYFIARKN